LSQDRILYRDNATVHVAASTQDFKRWQRHKDDLLPTLFARYHPSRLDFVSEVNSELAGFSLYKESIKNELGWGCPNPKPLLETNPTIANLRYMDSCEKFV
jgi:hypothetical protein